MMAHAATLGGGCFWCLDAVYRQVQGVTAVIPGYAGGHVAEPSYAMVCTGETGHTEAVQVIFDAERVSYEDLLGIFFTIHDPTTLDRQGNDVGPQYRSVIFAQDDSQQATAARMVKTLNAARIWPAPIVTAIEPLDEFWPAEAEHHNYYERNPWAGYCRVVISPKIKKFREKYDRLLKPVAPE